MNPLRIRRGVIRNVAEIIALAERYRDRFMSYPTSSASAHRAGRPAPKPFNPYRPSEYEEEDRYHVLQQNRMPVDLWRAACRTFVEHGIPARSFYIQLQRYELGDFVLPHRDELLQGLYVLTSSARDGLTVQDGAGGWMWVADEPGTLIVADLAAWHWVDPVVDPVRYTMITIPPLLDSSEPDAGTPR